MRRVAAAAVTKLAKLKTFRRRLLILRRRVVAAFAFGALQHYIIACHKEPFLLLL
jgi:hypothetical protein